MNDDPNLRARLLYRQRRYDLALQAALEVLADDPHDTVAQMTVAMCHYFLDRDQEAVDAARLVIQTEPDLAIAHYCLGLALYGCHQFEESLESLEESLRLDPQSYWVHAALATIHTESGNLVEALLQIERGLSIEPEDESLKNLWSYVQYHLGQQGAAAEMLKSVLEQNPTASSTHSHLGWIAIWEGHPFEAIEHFREALRLDPEDIRSRSGLAEAVKCKVFLYRWLYYGCLRFQQRTRRPLGILTLSFFVSCGLYLGIWYQPSAAPYLWPVLGVGVTLLLLAFVSIPLCSLLLRCRREVRLAVSQAEIDDGNLLAGYLARAAFLFPAGYLLDNGYFRASAWLFLASALPLAMSFYCVVGPSQQCLQRIAGFLYYLALVLAVLPLLTMLGCSNQFVASVGYRIVYTHVFTLVISLFFGIYAVHAAGVAIRPAPRPRRGAMARRSHDRAAQTHPN